MRDPKRLDGFYDEVKRIHKEYFPEWRFGQLMTNYFRWLYVVAPDPFFLEEDRMLECLRSYARTHSKWKVE